MDKNMPKQIEACHQSLGSRIRLTREAIGMTQEELSRKLPKGVTRASLANIETGRQRFLLDRGRGFCAGPQHDAEASAQRNLVVAGMTDPTTIETL